jgi:cell division protein FtsL
MRPVAPHRLRETARLLALGGLVAAVALLYAWQHFACIQLRYQVESLKSQRAQAAELNQELRLEVAGLRAPSRIDEIARRQLGLTAPAAGQLAPFEAPSEAVLAEMRRTSSTRAQ